MILGMFKRHAAQTYLLFGLCALSLHATGSGSAAELYPTSAFAALPNMEFPVLSPDGTHIAFLRSVDGKRALFVGKRNTISTDAAHINITAEVEFDIDGFRWVSNRYLVVATNFTGRRGNLDTVETRLLTVSREGAKLKSIDIIRNGHQAQIQTDIIDALEHDPNRILLSMEGTSKGRVDVYRLNVRTGRVRLIERGTKDTSRWITDNSGNVRVRIDVKGTQSTIFVKSIGSSWRVLKRFDYFNAPHFDPVGLINDDTLYVISTHENGRRGVYTYSISENTFKERLFLQDEVDVLRIAHYRDGRLWGFQYVDGKFITDVLDDDARRYHATVNTLLPDTFNLFLNSSANEKYFLIFASTPNDPGTYYLFDSAQGTVKDIGARYPDLDPSNLGKVEPFEFKARDGRKISGYVTLPVGASLFDSRAKWPVVVMPHGGPRGLDYPSFEYTAHFLANRGYAVLKINFRGSLGFGQEFEALGFREWGGAIQNDITDGLRALTQRGFADRERTCIAGGSFGGYSALISAARWPTLYRCAASLNGAMDLLRFAKYAESYRFSDLVARRLGHPSDDAARLRDMSPINLAEKIRAPILLVHGTADRRVTSDHSIDMAKALKDAGKDVNLVLIPEADHVLSRTAYRLAYLTALEKFLERHLQN